MLMSVSVCNGSVVITVHAGKRVSRYASHESHVRRQGPISVQSEDAGVAPNLC